FRLAGRSVIINFLSVAAGFLVLTFSDLVPLQRFGVSVALTMISSGFASLTLLPALLLRTKNIWNKHFLKQ
ncbi:MAG TPA: MMPL family transporter, partial [Bacteroidales bacterium]|nr:MMPL family transporter [Bacteroidales bacterium]